MSETLIACDQCGRGIDGEQYCGDCMAETCARVAELEAALADVTASHKLQLRAGERARKLYIEAHGIDYWPDAAVNMVWCMEQITAAEARVSDLEAAFRCEERDHAETRATLADLRAVVGEVRGIEQRLHSYGNIRETECTPEEYELRRSALELRAILGRADTDTGEGATCGDCFWWMKSSRCPREHNVNGQTKGPSCGSFPCDEFLSKAAALDRADTGTVSETETVADTATGEGE